MKKITGILLLCLSVSICSCSDDGLSGVWEKENKNKRCVTFHLSKKNDDKLGMTTRNADVMPITEEYSVMFYLFQAEGNEYKLIREPEFVTNPVLSVEGLTEDAEYKYVFVAIYNPTKNVAISNVLKAEDFGTTVMTPGDWTIELPALASAAANSLLRNCFLNFIDNTQYPTYGDSDDPASIETIVMERNLDIFGAGSYFLPGTVSTAIGVVLERQVGVVEFKYAEAAPGDQLECSFSSDYYRLYLSQMVKDKVNTDYTSQNTAGFSFASEDPDNPLAGYSQGDYYSASRLFYTNFVGIPAFKKTVTLAGTENSVKVYMPYTTAEKVGTEVADLYKAHFIRTAFTGYDVNTPGNITLTITKAGGTKQEFKKNGTPFPIYRNGSTVFTTVGSDFLSIGFGNNVTDDGIYLPDNDKWNGDN